MSLIENFTGHNGQSVAKWIDSVEIYFLVRQIPENERLGFALKNLSDPVKTCALSLTHPLMKISGKAWEWDWVRLKVALRGIEKQIEKCGAGKKGRSVGKVAAIGFLVGAAGPIALGLGLAATGACAIVGSIAALRGSSNLEIPQRFKGLRTIVLAESSNRSSANSGAAIGMIQDIMKKEASKSWTDAKNFRPSIELINELLELLIPEKDIR